MALLVKTETIQVIAVDDYGISLTFYIPTSGHVPIVPQSLWQQFLPKRRYYLQGSHFSPNKELTALYYLHNQTLCWKVKYMTMRSERIVDNELFGVTEKKNGEEGIM